MATTTTTTQPIARPYHRGILGEAVAVEMGVPVRAQATNQAACTV